MKFDFEEHEYEKEEKQKPERTEQEIAFLSHLGTNSFGTVSEKVLKTPRKELLRRYLNSCKKRKHWDGIDKSQVIITARSMMKLC